MSLTYIEATDDMIEMVKTVWDTTGHPIQFPDIDDSPQKLEAAETYAQVFIEHEYGGQSSLASPNGTKKFARSGTLSVLIFVRAGKGLQESYALAKVVSDAFEGKSSSRGVWFRNVSIREAGKKGVRQQMNVTAIFEYHEVK